VDPRVKELLNGFKEKGSSHIQGKKAFELLQGYGIPVVHSQFANELQGILKAAEGMGYPVALKISSPQITHKTDAGGLALNIGNRTEMELAYESMLEAVKTKSPRANIDGFLVQKMIGGGLEVILGAKRDPQFGPTILFGTGGIYTEVWKDIAYGIAPLSPEEARRMIRQTKSHEILKGVRGESGYDMDILVSCLLRLSQLMMDMEDIKEVDINPFGVFSKGGLALDARIIL
jgi:acyl-CoA synthetase (NDP forming)